MNSENNGLNLWVEQATAFYLLRKHGRKDFVNDLLQGGSWKEFTYRRLSKNPFRLAAYRFDFGTDPEPFLRLMQEGRVTALFCEKAGGDPLISRHPIASYRQVGGRCSRYACLYVLDEVAPGRWRKS